MARDLSVLFVRSRQQQQQPHSEDLLDLLDSDSGSARARPLRRPASRLSGRASRFSYRFWPLSVGELGKCWTFEPNTFLSGQPIPAAGELERRPQPPIVDRARLPGRRPADRSLAPPTIHGFRLATSPARIIHLKSRLLFASPPLVWRLVAVTRARADDDGEQIFSAKHPN